MNSIKLSFEVWESYVNKIGEMLLNDKYLVSQLFKKDINNFKITIKDYENNFIKYKTKEKFSIPIRGKVSSGKSTFLNSILLGNYLSSSSDIDTKFICILRNNINCKIPLLYNCKIKQENLNYKYKDSENEDNELKFYYFEKKEEIKGNILENIKKINKELIDYEKIYDEDERDLNKYFYILELSIPLFNKYEELGEYFQLMDIPGLNVNFDFYFKKIIPIIANKCLFSIYIFDFLNYVDIETLKIYNEYSKQLNKFYNGNSIYILNKIDEIKEEDIKNNKDVEYHFKNFKKYLSGTDEKEKYKSENNDIKEEAKEIHEIDENKKDDKDENKKEEKKMKNVM